MGNFTSRQQGHFTFITTIANTTSFSLNFAHRDKKTLDNGSLLHPFLGLFHSTRVKILTGNPRVPVGLQVEVGYRSGKPVELVYFVRLIEFKLDSNLVHF